MPHVDSSFIISSGCSLISEPVYISTYVLASLKILFLLSRDNGHVEQSDKEDHPLLVMEMANLTPHLSQLFECDPRRNPDLGA